jgi:hypothetical protein
VTTPTAPRRRAYRRYTIDLDTDLHRRVKIAAVEDDQPVSDIVRDLLEQWLHDRAAQASLVAPTEAAEAVAQTPAEVPAPARKPLLDERAVRFLADAKKRAARAEEFSKPLPSSPFAPSDDNPLPAAHDVG